MPWQRCLPVAERVRAFILTPGCKAEPVHRAVALLADARRRSGLERLHRNWSGWLEGVDAVRLEAAQAQVDRRDARSVQVLRQDCCPGVLRLPYVNEERDARPPHGLRHLDERPHGKRKEHLAGVVEKAHPLGEAGVTERQQHARDEELRVDTVLREHAEAVEEEMRLVAALDRIDDRDGVLNAVAPELVLEPGVVVGQRVNMVLVVVPHLVRRPLANEADREVGRVADPRRE